MTYAERLAEFQRVTGHKPGEINRRKGYEPAGRESSGITAAPRAEALQFCKDCDGLLGVDCRCLVSLEPPRQSSGPGRCNRFTRAVALGDPTPCKLAENHEGPHEP